MRPYNRRQHWNANVRPPAHQLQQSARNQSPPRQPYYHGGNQQQNRNANMRPPAQRQQQSAQHPSPPQQPYHYGDGAAGNVGGVDEVRTLYIGRLQDWMDEDYLNSCFGPDEQLVSARTILNKHTGESEGYGFLEFSSHAAAENILQSFDGKKMPDAEQIFKLNWASPKAEDFKIIVGNLHVSVTDRVLLEKFKSEYPSVKSAEVIRDPSTGHSKGFVLRHNDRCN